MTTMMHSQPASRRRWYGSAVAAVALVAAASLGGCAGTTDAGLDAPYQVAGPVVPHTSARATYQACAGGASGFVDDCSGFARYYGP